MPSHPSTCRKELQTGGAERELPPTPPWPEAARPSESWAFPLPTLQPLWVQTGARGSSRSSCAPSPADRGPPCWMPLPTAAPGGHPEPGVTSAHVWAGTAPCGGAQDMKRPSRHEGTPSEVTAATVMPAAGLCPAVGCAQTEPGGRLGSPGGRVPGTGTLCSAPLLTGSRPAGLGCLLPAASWRTVRGDRLGWTRGPPSTSLTERARPCV